MIRFVLLLGARDIRCRANARLAESQRGNCCAITPPWSRWTPPTRRGMKPKWSTYVKKVLEAEGIPVICGERIPPAPT